MLSRCALCLSIALLLVSHASGGALNPSNLIVTWSGYPSSFAQEYTPTGTLVQSWTITSTFSTENARDVGVDSAGDVVVYNGTFSPFLTIINPTTGVKTNYTYPGWDTANSTIIGGLAVSGHYAYATDTVIGSESGDQSGIVRFDLTNGTAQRYIAGTNTTSVAIGLNNKLYAVWPDSSPGENELSVIDAATMTLERTINLTMSLSGATADAAGNIYGTSGSTIYKLDSDGNVLASLDTHFAVDNIKISASGQLIADNNGGQIVLSTTALTSSSEWSLNEPNAQLYASYADFAAALPEPSCALGGVMVIAALRRRRRARI